MSAARLAWTLWLLWFGSAMYSATRHDLQGPIVPNVRDNGCFELYQFVKVPLWPGMHRTKQFVCVRTLATFPPVDR